MSRDSTVESERTPTSSGVNYRRLVFWSAALTLVSLLAIERLGQAATLVTQLSATSPLMGTWRLAEDDYDFEARGLDVPDTLVIESCEEGDLPTGFEPGTVARLSGNGHSVLFTTEVVYQPVVPGSGISPFADIGAPDGVSMILGLRGWTGLFDTLDIDPGLDPNVAPMSRGSRRLTYHRDGMRAEQR